MSLRSKALALVEVLLRVPPLFVVDEFLKISLGLPVSGAEEVTLLSNVSIDHVDMPDSETYYDANFYNAFVFTLMKFLVCCLAVVPTTSLGVQAKPLPTPSRRTIAVPLSPSSSKLWTRSNLPDPVVKSVPTNSLGVGTRIISASRLTIAVPLSPTSSRLTTGDLPSSLVSKSVQTFHFPGRSVETVTSNTELPKHGPAKDITKKSKSINDFRLKRDFKSEILEWFDDTSDPKIKEIQEAVLENLNFRLKGVSVTGTDKIKVKVGNCLKCCNQTDSKEASSCEVNKKKRASKTTQNLNVSKAEDSADVTDLDEFKDVIKEWLKTMDVKKPDRLSKPVEKEQMLNTFIDTLKTLAFEKSKFFSEQTIKAEILRIIDEVLIKVNECDKAAFLNKLTAALFCKLDNILPGETKMYPSADTVSDNSNANLHKNHTNCEETNNSVVREKTHKMSNADLIKQAIVDLVDILKDSVNNNIGLVEIASTLHDTTKHSEKEAFKNPAKLTENCENIHIRTHPLAVFMVQNLSKNYVSKTSGTNVSQHSIGSLVDKDFDKHLIQYKTQLAKKIDQWLSDLAILRAKNTDFKQAVVLDLASDIVDRQKYLAFSKNKTADIVELENLKYLIFKWMKRYVGEENMETLHHAGELMEMIKNIPVPMISSSHQLLYKSPSHGTYKKNHCEPGISTDQSKDNVYNSKFDSGMHSHRESPNGSVLSYIEKDNATLSKKRNDSSKQKLTGQTSLLGSRSDKPTFSSTNEENYTDSSNCSLENKKNAYNILNNKQTSNIKSSGVHDDFKNVNTAEAFQNYTNGPNNIHKGGHSSQDTFVSSRSRDDIHEFYSASCKDHIDEPGISIEISKDDLHFLKSNYSNCSQKRLQNDSLLTNYVVHEVMQTNKTNDISNPKEEITSKRSSSKSKKKSSKTSKDSSNCEAKCSSKNSSPCDVLITSPNKNDEPGPSGLVTPVPSRSGKPSSAAAQLMAEWRPQPVFRTPPPGRPLIDQVHEEFKEYLQNWCHQLPIPATSCEEIKIAEKSRLGILNGIWKMLTKLKTQPAVFQNKFYYEDVLGKEIDGLLDCLPQTQELAEKRYTLKSQLLEKISDMNDLVKELEMPDNYKEMVAQKVKLMKDQKLRKTVRLDRESPTKIIEEMLKYCTLDDFLGRIDYKETNKVLSKAYKNRLLQRIQSYIDDLKKKHGKEIEQLFDFWKECDVFKVLQKVPFPTEDTIREDADEILLGLEIEQWMMDLPIIKNDDGNEQRQRTRLRDALTRKIHELEKRVDISDCCGDTQVKHEISYFLDMVPLEKDQDLNINEMVDELTNRLKNRHGTGVRRRSVTFQDGGRYHGSQSNRLLNRSDFTYGPTAPDVFSPEDKRALHEDDDAQYRSMFRNAPLCSTRIDQQNEWGLDEDQDAQYGSFKDGVACSTMINQPGYEPDPRMPADFRHSYDQAPHPGQFHESARGGSFGYPLDAHPEERYHYPEAIGSPMSSRQRQQSSRFYESPADMPNAPISDSQYQSLLSQGPPGVKAHQVPPRMMGRAFDQSYGIEWAPHHASGFVSLRDDGPSRSPVQRLPPQCLSNGPVFSSHQSHIHPHMSLLSERPEPQSFRQTSYRDPREKTIASNQLPGEVLQPSFQSAAQNEPFITPEPAFIPDDSRVSRASAPVFVPDDSPRRGSPPKSNSIEPSIRQEPLEASVQVHEAPRSRNHELQDDTGQGFMSLISHQRQSEQAQNRSLRVPIDQKSNQPSIRVTPARDRSSDPEEIQDAQNRSGHRYNLIQPSQAQSQQSRDHAPTGRLTEEAREPSPPQRFSPSEISNQPAFYSTPNQRTGPPPHDIRERRQLEKERAPARRLGMETDPEEGDERCQCRERFKQWNRRTYCQTCDDCMHGAYYPYPYHYPYMYPPFGRPPYPPHCRR